MIFMKMIQEYLPSNNIIKYCIPYLYFLVVGALLLSLIFIFAPRILPVATIKYSPFMSQVIEAVSLNSHEMLDREEKRKIITDLDKRCEGITRSEIQEINSLLPSLSPKESQIALYMLSVSTATTNHQY